MAHKTVLPTVQHWAAKLECPVDEDADYENTTWCNRDLIPIPEDRRTWIWQGYAGYWIMTGVNTSAWTFGSTLLSLGLSVKQAMGVVVGGSLISAFLAVVAGWMGSHQYLGFTVLSRSSWGMKGAYWPVLNRVVTACIWMGIQLYWGGQAARLIIGAIWPSFAKMRNTLPPGANVKTNDLIAFFVFAAVFAPTLMIPPERLQTPFRVAFIMIIATIFGMVGWAVHAAAGPGELFYAKSTAGGSTLSWNAVYGLQTIVGAYGSGILGQSDWTRYSKTPNAALFGQAITAPLAITLTALCGVVITSASATIYGEYLWNPFELLIRVQQSFTPAARAGTFFAGCGLAASQLMLCIALNAMSAGMDMAALAPRWINIRRGTYILTVIAIAVCPWNYVTKATTFITVLSGWSVFLSPMTGILCSDYFMVRRQQLHVGDLYISGDKGVYWYWHGFNFRGVTAWCMGLWPLLPGFVRSVRGTTANSGFDHIYFLSYFVGFFISFTVYWVLNLLFPIRGQHGSSPFVMELHRRQDRRVSSHESSTSVQYVKEAPIKEQGV